MCGRFTQKTPPLELAKAFELAETPPDLGPRYNIAPSLDVLVVANREGPRLAEPMRWGLVPYWATDPGIGNKLANARCETLAEKPSFREALRRRRCLVLADGFYEWRSEGRVKSPYWFHLADERPFALAGIWETWRPKDQPDAERLLSCCLITTDANAVVGDVHDRMPVILHPDDYARWLQPEPVAAVDLQPLLRPFADAALVATPVSRFVNDARNEGPRCLEPAGPVGLPF